MARVTAAGGRVAAVHATFGEHGTDDPTTWPPGRLRDRRVTELRAALGLCGVRQADTEILGYADGGCVEVPATEAVERIEASIRRMDPEVIVTFGPDGITGHPDHQAVSRWTTAAWHRTGGRARLLYAANTVSFMDRHRELHRRLGIFPEDATATPDDAICLALRLDEREIGRKRRVLAAHATQTTGLAEAMGESVYRDWSAVEAFRSPTEADLHAATTLAGAA
jgi:LmbE family N-acetylglucosaminyl deacetylase